MPEGALQPGRRNMSLRAPRLIGSNVWQYDSNAIRVDNVLGHQIGHIPRTVAEKLAPYLVGTRIDNRPIDLLSDCSLFFRTLVTLPSKPSSPA